MSTNTLGLIFIHMDILSHLVKGEESKVCQRYETFIGVLRKEAVVIVTCWELKSHIFKTLVLPTFMYGTKIWGGDLKNSHWKDLEKGVEMLMLSHVKVHSWTTYHILLAKFRELPMELYALKLTMGFQQQFAHLPPFWLVKKIILTIPTPAQTRI
jgi:hypothetical protein